MLSRLALTLGVSCLAVGLAACAQGGGGSGSDGPDNGGPPGGLDGGSPTTSCPAGQHPCSGECVDDLPNEVANGCRLGCGSPCPMQTGGEPICNDDGTCGFQCQAPYEPEPTSGVCRCVPQTCNARNISCGMTDDGCGLTLDCGSCADGSDCIDGKCTCPQDDAEPNEDRFRAYDLGFFTDDPDTERSFVDFGLSSPVDADFFFAGVDNEGAGNPLVRVTLSDVPSGHVYDVGVWFSCSIGSNMHRCDMGKDDETFGQGCVASTADFNGMTRIHLSTFCQTRDTDGSVLVRVTPVTWADTCGTYSLNVSVL